MKRLVWIASSRQDLRAFPPAVRRTFGVALYAVQVGETPPIAKPLKGFGGARVLELADDYKSGTYRAVYTVRFSTAVYVLHAFQKKSTRGRATSRHDIELVKSRLRMAEAVHKAKQSETRS